MLQLPTVTPSLTRLWLCQIHTDYEVEKWSSDSIHPCQNPIPTVNICDFNSAYTDPTFWVGIQWLNGQLQVTDNTVLPQHSPNLFTWNPVVCFLVVDKTRRHQTAASNAKKNKFLKLIYPMHLHPLMKRFDTPSFSHESMFLFDGRINVRRCKCEQRPEIEWGASRAFQKVLELLHLLFAHFVSLLLSANIHFSPAIQHVCMIISNVIDTVGALLLVPQFSVLNACTSQHLPYDALCLSIFALLCSSDCPCDMDHVSESNTQKNINCKTQVHFWTRNKFATQFVKTRHAA